MVATSIRVAVISVVAAISCPALSQTLPADCSKGPVPAQPLAVSIAGVKFAPKEVKLRSGGGMTQGDAKLDGYTLALRNESDLFAPLELEISVIVRAGERIDGKVFRKLPVKETDKQPAPAKGLPEVQGWSMKDRDKHTDLSHVSYLASLRLEFGKREGNTIAGKIYLCVPKGQTTMFDKTPTKEDSYAIGAFQARLD